MSGPERRRPGANSPIKLTANVEPVRTGPDAEPPAPEALITPRAQRAGSLKEPTIPTTVTVRESLKKRAQTAVLRTAALPDGYKSFAALVDGALERELERLAGEHNGGVPFEPNAGAFRTGRPFGS
jgi:hypothetical protein